MIEKWKDLIGYEGIYKISNMGEIFSIKKSIKLKQRKNNKGYHIISLYKSGLGKSDHLVHRLVMLNFTETIEGKNQANHIDGNKSNNVLSNLEWVTQSENMKHAYDNSLRGKQTLSDEQKRNMCQGRKKSKNMGGYRKKIEQYNLTTNKTIRVFNTVAEAAKTFNCHYSSIADVATGKNGRKSSKGFGWRYVK